MRFILVVCMLTASLARAEIQMSFSPEKPTRDDKVRIEIRPCSQGGFLHWGVNARANNWQQAIPAYRPKGSVMDGIATRTRLTGPDEQGVSSVQLGPFNDTNQLVGTVDFAIQWDDGEWETRNGKDYHVPIHSDRISIVPPMPMLSDFITVTVRRSKPGGQLRWGVNATHGLWRPPHTNYWPLGTVPSEDGLAVDTPLSPPNEKGESTAGLGAFDLPVQVVTSVHMAVHWGDEWDTDFGRNYNFEIRLSADEPQVAIESPADGSRITEDVDVALRTSHDMPILLWLNGTPAVTVLDPDYKWRLPAAGLPFGRHVLVARWGISSDAGMARSEFWRVPDFPRADPAEKLELGATERTDGNVTFALHAPGKHFVSVVGDFNDWDPQADIMTLSSDGTWWTTMALEPGTYQYQYCINGEAYVADPYSTDVEWKDENGEETHIPAMAKSVLEVGAEPFEWSDSEFERPPLDRLLIYEFFIDDLCTGQGFTGVVAKLDYIRDLGVNAIEPLPWNEFTGAGSWGYNPSFHFAPETTYGTPEELKQLIDEAHQRGLAVIMDMVLNHMDAQSPLFQLYGIDYDASPYFHLFLGENWGFPDLDQESPAFKRYVADLLRFWIEEYHVDGFRYDATRWVGWQGYNDWGASWFAYAAKQADRGAYQIAEHLPTDPELMNTTEMDTGWHAHFRWRVRDMLRSGKLDREEFRRIMEPERLGFSNALQRIAYTESHDEERVVGELLEAGYTEEEAVRRATAALAVTMTAPGVTMVYGGQEFGEDSKKVVGRNPLHWEYTDDPLRSWLQHVLRRLARLRTQHPALGTDTVRFAERTLPGNVAVYERGNPDEPLIVAVNFGKTSERVSLSLPSGRIWRNILDPAMTGREGGRATLEMAPGEAAVFEGVED